jgi:hypothetical protein
VTAVRSFPPASACDRDTLLHIAAFAARGQSWELLGSSAHVEAICRLLVEEIEPDLRVAEAELRRRGCAPGSQAIGYDSDQPTARKGEPS